MLTAGNEFGSFEMPETVIKLVRPPFTATDHMTVPQALIGRHEAGLQPLLDRFVLGDACSDDSGGAERRGMHVMWCDVV